jgi:hypothetical protein
MLIWNSILYPVEGILENILSDFSKYYKAVLSAPFDKCAYPIYA